MLFELPAVVGFCTLFAGRGGVGATEGVCVTGGVGATGGVGLIGGAGSI